MKITLAVNIGADVVLKNAVTGTGLMVVFRTNATPDYPPSTVKWFGFERACR
jgi:hypothetical protein